MASLEFTERVTVRLRPAEREAIRKLMRKHKDLYTNESAVIRAGLLTLLRQRAGYIAPLRGKVKY